MTLGDTLYKSGGTGFAFPSEGTNHKTGFDSDPTIPVQTGRQDPGRGRSRATRFDRVVSQNRLRF